MADADHFLHCGKWVVRHGIFVPDLVAVKPLGKMIILVLIFAVLGRFLATVGPKTPFNGSGSKNCAERT